MPEVSEEATSRSAMIVASVLLSVCVCLFSIFSIHECYSVALTLVPSLLLKFIQLCVCMCTVLAVSACMFPAVSHQLFDRDWGPGCYRNRYDHSS